MAPVEEKKFGILRTLFWPIHRSEFKKVFSLLSLLFILCINYSILRNLKDTLLLTAKNSGAEAIPFVKVWAMLPGAFLATWIYTRLSRRFNRENVFYFIISGFLAYFLLFAFVIYPHSEALYLDRVAEWLTAHLPKGFKGLIALIANWSITTCYVVCELWAVMVLIVLYWGFTNDTTPVSEAKRTYGILNIGSNTAPLLGGMLALLFSNHLSFSFLGNSVNPWENTIKQLMIVVAFFGMLGMALFYWINRKVVSVNAIAQTKKEGKETSKLKLSVRESIRYISKSKYLLCIALIVVGYNLSINITDILWKEQLKNYFSNPADMLAHMNKITMGIGIFATMGGLLFSLMISRLGWTFVALLTPTIMTVMAIGFFTFLFAGNAFEGIAYSLFGVGPIALTVYFGSLQNCLSKAGKYSVFDATKEMAFLPLDADARLKGKAAIDGLGSSVGKSGASLLYQGFLILLGSVPLSTPYISVILFLVFGAWIYSAFVVGKSFKVISKEPAAARAE